MTITGTQAYLPFPRNGRVSANWLNIIGRVPSAKRTDWAKGDQSNEEYTGCVSQVPDCFQKKRRSRKLVGRRASIPQSEARCNQRQRFLSILRAL